MKELTQLWKLANKLSRKSFKLHNLPEHSIHAEHKEAMKTYDSTLRHTKRQHWRDWLERADNPDIWTANRYVLAPASDGGKARIPILKHAENGQEALARSNEEKSHMLAKAFFPPKPQGSAVDEPYDYPPQCQGNIWIMADQI
jgi:hypothetical protein